MSSGQAETTPGAQAGADLRRLAAAFDGTLAVAAHDRRSGERVTLAADRSMQTASVIKLSVLVAVYERARTGELSLDDRVTVTDEARIGGSGIVKDLSTGTALTIRDLATTMVVVSDNMATNMLVDVAGGVDAVNAFVHSRLGLETIVLHRKLLHVGGPGPLAVATPSELVALIDGLIDGRIVSPAASAEMLAILARQQYLDQVSRLIDREQLSDPDEDGERGGTIAVAAKTGMIDGVRADTGVLWLAGDAGDTGDAVSYAVMAESAGDGGLDLDTDCQLVNAEAGAILVRRFWPGADDGDGANAPVARHPAERWARLHRAATQPAE